MEWVSCGGVGVFVCFMINKLDERRALRVIGEGLWPCQRAAGGGGAA